MLKKKERKIKNIRTYYLTDTDLELQEKIDEMASRERVSTSAIIIDALAEYHKNHGDGNPAFTLDHFQDPDFLETPALCRNSEKWTAYLETANPILKEEIKQHILRVDRVLSRFL